MADPNPNNHLNTTEFKNLYLSSTYEKHLRLYLACYVTFCYAPLLPRVTAIQANKQGYLLSPISCCIYNTHFVLLLWSYPARTPLLYSEKFVTLINHPVPSPSFTRRRLLFRVWVNVQIYKKYTILLIFMSHPSSNPPQSTPADENFSNINNNCH